MNLGKRVLFSCPVIVALLVVGGKLAEVHMSDSLSQSVWGGSVAVDHATLIAQAPASDRPSIPTGCTCARCTRVEELLQGQFLI